MKMKQLLFVSLTFLFSFVTYQNAYGQIVNIGSGSYTTTFPGTDAAGRNGFPSGTPFTEMVQKLRTEI